MRLYQRIIGVLLFPVLLVNPSFKKAFDFHLQRASSLDQLPFSEQALSPSPIASEAPPLEGKEASASLRRQRFERAIHRPQSSIEVVPLVRAYDVASARVVEPVDDESQKPLGSVSLANPIAFNVHSAAVASGLGSHLKTANGEEYILDANGRTIILFKNLSEGRFTEIYSPLTRIELGRLIVVLPNDQERLLRGALALSHKIVRTESPGLQSSSSLQLLGWPRVPSIPKVHAVVSRVGQPPADLPDDHFVSMQRPELDAKRHAHWENVKNLDANDPRRVLYYRRFTSEWRSSVAFDTRVAASLRVNSEPYHYYSVDTSRIDELPTEETYRTALSVPPGIKIGIVIGYHDLEKPWGQLFRQMFLNQTSFRQGSIEFIVIQNKDVPTGDRSLRSEEEIRNAVAQHGFTHIIDVHEELSSLNNYMDHNTAAEFNDTFRIGSSKIPNGREYTLDPFVPLWVIEQYYDGKIYPQLQYGVNEQIKKVEKLINGLSATENLHESHFAGAQIGTNKWFQPILRWFWMLTGVTPLHEYAHVASAKVAGQRYSASLEDLWYNGEVRRIHSRPLLMGALANFAIIPLTMHVLGIPIDLNVTHVALHPLSIILSYLAGTHAVAGLIETFSRQGDVRKYLGPLYQEFLRAA